MPVRVAIAHGSGNRLHGAVRFQVRVRVTFVILSVISVVLTGLLNPGTASAAPGSSAGAPPAASSCDSPPDTPDATPENRDRFIDLWSERMADKGWLEHYTELATVPESIRDEGFHDLDGETQLWLNACLLDDMLATAGEPASAEERADYLMGLTMVIFGKEGIAQMREELAEQAPADPDAQLPVPEDLTDSALQEMSDELLGEPSLTPASQPETDVPTPTPSRTRNLAAQTSPELRELLSEPAVEPDPTDPEPAPEPEPAPVSLEPAPVTRVPGVPQLLEAVEELAQLVSRIQGQLFTLPVVNLLAPAFYKICAESPSLPLSCSVSLPVGVPIPADVTGDRLPEVVASLTPVVNLTSGRIGARFQVQRMYPGQGPLPAHVFAVYDTPFVKKRIEVGYDGRSSSLANNTVTTFTLEDALKAINGDIRVKADVSSNNPGATESLTFAVKSLVGGSIGVPATEADPMTGAVQMDPFPDKFTVDAHMIHQSEDRSQDVFTVTSTTPTTVDALIDQRTAASSRRFTATVDELPSSVTVDLVREGEQQHIDYDGSAPIERVRATDTSVPDVSEPRTYAQSVYQVRGVPTEVDVDLVGTEDITYVADGQVSEVSFSTDTVVEGDVHQQVQAAARQVPEEVHVVNTATDDQTAVTYEANAELQDLDLTLFSLGEEPEDKLHLVAHAEGIPTDLAFTQTESTGVMDLAAEGGVDLIEATLALGGGTLLPLDGDHATVHKRGDALGADLRVTGFESLHFDGSEDTTVSVGLEPGGQSFEAIADLDDPNVHARAYVAELPKDMSVTISPAAGTATYTGDSVIPLLEGSFTDRDTEAFASVALTDLPERIGLTFNTSGDTPQITYDADSRLGSIDATYQEAPDGLALHAEISDLPPYLSIGGIDPMVFDARTSVDGEPGSSYLGQVLFQYATDGTFQSPPTTDDHVYLDTLDGTHAELQYSGLEYLSVDTSDEQLRAEIRNASPRVLRAFLTTPTLELTGFIEKVPDEITLTQVGNEISYVSSAPIERIYTDLSRANGDEVAVDITDVPAEVTLVLDGTGSTLDWQASGATGGIAAVAHLTPESVDGPKPFDAGLTITSIPEEWDASWAEGDVRFEAPAAGIGSIVAHVTNHGGYQLLPGDHLTASYDEASGNVDASLRVSNLRTASFTQLTGTDAGGFEAELDMGDQSGFAFAADVTLDDGEGAHSETGDTELHVDGAFTALPSELTLRSEDGRITYQGDSNPSLALAVEAGTAAALAATPAPGSVHGLSVRDGAGGGGEAVRISLYLTGLPSSLDLNAPAGTYAVGDYHPSVATLVVDVVLDALAEVPTTLQVQQVVPTADPVEFTFGPFDTTTAPDGTHSLHLVYSASQELGSLVAEVTYGDTDDARLEISSIPRSIDVTADFGADQKAVAVTMDSGISDITASYKKVGEADFAASVHLHDVPREVDVLIGRGTSTEGGKEVTAPDFTMTASEPGLDISATASAEIATPADIEAAVDLQVVDLGQTLTGTLEGTSLHVTSTPATGSLLLVAAGGVNMDFDLGFSGGGFTNTGNLNADVDLDRLTVGFQDAADLRLDLGITTGLRGDFDQFTFGLDTDTEIHITDDLDFFIDWPDPFPTSTIDLFSIDTVIDFENVIDGFHVNSNTFGEMFDIPFFHFGIGKCAVDFNFRPGPGFTTAGSTLSLGPPPYDGSDPAAWLITPDLNLLGVSLPDFALDLIAWFASPYGKDFSIDAGCEVF